MNKHWKALAVICALVICLTLIWINRYQYEHAGTALVRVNRFTGQGCYFVEGKWDSRTWGEPLPKSQANTFSPSAFMQQEQTKDGATIFGAFNGKPNLCE
jgi:hypothetical protein